MNHSLREAITKVPEDVVGFASAGPLPWEELFPTCQDTRRDGKLVHLGKVGFLFSDTKHQTV